MESDAMMYRKLTAFSSWLFTWVGRNALQFADDEPFATPSSASRLLFRRHTTTADVLRQRRGIGQATCARQLAGCTQRVRQNETRGLPPAPGATTIVLEAVALDAVAAVIHDAAPQLAALDPPQAVLSLRFFCAALLRLVRRICGPALLKHAHIQQEPGACTYGLLLLARLPVSRQERRGTGYHCDSRSKSLKRVT